MHSTCKRSLLSTLLVSLVLTSAVSLSPLSQAANQSELTGVKSEIKRQQQELVTQQKELDKLQKSLREQEVGIANIQKAIKETEQKLRQSNHNIDAITQKISRLSQQKIAQQTMLEELISTYYATQSSGSNGNIFNSDPNEQRMSQYYQHLAKARTETLKKLSETERQLVENQQALQAEKQQIATLLEQQKSDKTTLTNSRSSRKNTVKKISSNISSDKSYLAELQRNETRLKAEIAKAAKRNQVPMNGLASQKGKLPWPIKGEVLHRFGTKQTGHVDWKGMVIKANYGDAVKSVYSGTVVFADYLRGYGLVILLDHGKGDMTLYGFNQTLLKKEGDKVIAGETIALAGDTGGQPSASLYFEIRRNSRVQNPTAWLTR